MHDTDLAERLRATCHACGQPDLAAEPTLEELDAFAQEAAAAADQGPSYAALPDAAAAVEESRQEAAQIATPSRCGGCCEPRAIPCKKDCPERLLGGF